MSSRWQPATTARTRKADERRAQLRALTSGGVHWQRAAYSLGISERTAKRYRRAERELGISGYGADGAPF